MRQLIRQNIGVGLPACALRWEGVDLVARITIQQNVLLGHIGTPKSGKARAIALGDELLDPLEKHRHLRGSVVFCRMDGGMMNNGEIKWRFPPIRPVSVVWQRDRRCCGAAVFVSAA
jgi:hypothetical protein